jgi:hypothetical protein
VTDTITLYVALTYHGFGHVAQTAPIVNVLMEEEPLLRLVIESLAPRSLLQRHFHHPFEHLECGTDFGMVMHDSLDVDAEASHRRYGEQLQQWDALIADSRARLQQHRAALLFGNVPYVPLVAAHQLGIPSVSMCSLHWANIYQAYCGQLPGGDAVHRRLLQAYRCGDVFVAPAPSMPMPELENIVRTGPIARIGKPCRRELAAQLAIAADMRLVAVFMGGVETGIPLADWPRTPGTHWLIAGTPCPSRPDMTAIESLPQPYIDILCSVDALVTKPGYGSFAEAACNGVPVLYVPREVWPESPHLAAWLVQHGQCLRLDREVLATGALMPRLTQLWAQPAAAPLPPTGIRQTAAILAAQIGL